MKCTVDKASSGMIYVSIFMKFGSVIRVIRSIKDVACKFERLW
jgi:hypothetical protein